MNRLTHLPHKISIVLIGLLLAHFALYYPSLPDYMATHFGTGGRPDGWMSKNGFIVFEIALISLIGFLKFGLPKLIKSVPISLVNLPNREYWFTPERKEESLSVLSRELGWVFVGTLFLMIAVNQLVYQANIAENKRLSDWFLVLLIGFFVFIAVWIIRIVIIFRIPK